MDPTNSTTPTPNPSPAPATPPVPPVAPVAPAPGVPAPEAPVSPAPGAPVAPAPEAPVPPAPGAAVPASPTPGTPGAPINPVIQPSGAPATPPVNPIIRPTGVSATDPIMEPEKPAEPDPIEEELKAPMKAAAPVPGSIGSAVSGDAVANAEAAPTNGDNPFANGASKPTPSVSFNDPAAQPAAGDAKAANQAQGAKKPMNKNTLIALIVVAAIVVVALVVILVMQLMSSGGGGSQGNNGGTSGGGTVAVDDNGSNDKNDDSGTNDTGDKLHTKKDAAFVCTASTTSDEGEVMRQEVGFVVENEKLTEINLDMSVTDANGEQIQSSESTIEYADLAKEASIDTSAVDAQYLDTDGTVLVSIGELATAVQSSLNAGQTTLSYTCEAV